MANIRFDGRSVVITGAGRGLGRAYALEIAGRGGKVVVNDLGAADDGSKAAAESVVDEIRALGGEAVADFNSVSTPEGAAALIATAVKAFGKVDVVINNAGILRDASILKQTPDIFGAVLDVHLLGSFYVSQAAFGLMKEQGYGRFVFTTSAAGLYGNHGQANYCAAKLGIVGLSNVFSVEGAKNNIKSNVIAPGAKTRMTDMFGAIMDALKPECVAPMVAYLASEQCSETHAIYSAAGSKYSRVFIAETPGWIRAGDAIPTAEEIAAQIGAISAQEGYTVPRFMGDYPKK